MQDLKYLCLLKNETAFVLLFYIYEAPKSGFESFFSLAFGGSDLRAIVQVQSMHGQSQPSHDQRPAAIHHAH